MGKNPDKLLTDLQERLNYLRQLGVEYLYLPPVVRSSASSQRSRFLELKKKIKNCRACPLAETRTYAVPGEGSITAELMFVGEGPGYDEDQQGRPFVGRAGQLLTKIINAMEYKREDVYITNIVKCRPPDNRNPNIEEMEKCQPFLFEQIKFIQPKVIVALGNVPNHFFRKRREGITSLRGKFYKYMNIQVMPTFHPSYLIRNENNRQLKRLVWEDMKKVLAFIGKR